MSSFSSAAFESVFNLQPHLALLVEGTAPHHPVRAISDALLEFLGCRREAVLNRNLLEVLGPAFEPDSGDAEKALQKGFRSGMVSGTTVFPGRLKQGNSREGESPDIYLQLKSQLMEEGDGVPLFYLTAVPLSMPALPEVPPQESSPALREMWELISHSDISAFTLTPLWNEAGEIVDFRPRMMTDRVRRFLEAHPDVYDGKRIIMPEEHLFKLYQDTWHNGTVHSHSYHYHKEKTDKWVNISMTRVAGEEVLAVFTDQTDIRNMQERLEATITDLKRSNTHLEEFAYAASHDLQEPLRKIQTFCTMLHTRSASVLDAPSVALLARIQSASTRMRGFIEDLLQYSRLSLHDQPMEDTNLDSILKKVLREAADGLEVQGAQVHIEGLEPVCGAPGQLELLFKNLLDNSLKFAQEGRPLEVRISGKRVLGPDGDAASSTSTTSGKFLRIDFEDNGIGFEPQYAERVFQIFQRLHGRSEFAGNGVGLAIVQKIVHHHGGRIQASGSPGNGAAFTFWLPLAHTASCA